MTQNTSLSSFEAGLVELMITAGRILLMGMVNVTTETPCHSRMRDRARIQELSKEYQCTSLSRQEVHGEGAPNHITGNWGSERTMSDLECLVKTGVMPNLGRRRRQNTFRGEEEEEKQFDLVIWDYVWMQIGYAMFNENFVTLILLPFADRGILKLGGSVILPWTENIKQITQKNAKVIEPSFTISFIDNQHLHQHPLWNATEKLGADIMFDLGKVLSRQVDAHTLHGPIKFIKFTRV